MSERYRPYVADRPDLVVCTDCSSRATAVVVPVDETDQHDSFHAM